MILRRRLLTKQQQLMNVAMCDLITGELFQTPNPTLFSSELYEPIGIVVIPTEHDVYGTGECGIMALKSASLTTPDEGSETNEIIIYGYDGKSETDLKDLKKVCICGNENEQQIYPQIIGTDFSACLPSDQDSFSQIDNPYDPLTKYYYFDQNSYSPSPYNKDESKNEAYCQIESPSSEDNVLSYFDGKQNTQILCSKATAQLDWKTSTTIINNYKIGYYPAFCACWRYHTTGTNQGDWYLPACGELGYVCVRSKKINYTLSFIQEKFNNIVCGLDMHVYHTSTQYEYYINRIISFFNGIVTYTNKFGNCRVRPFTRKILPVRLKP